MLGVVLWKSLRSTILWAEADPTSRSTLFDEDAAERRQLEILVLASEDGDGLREALEDLVALLARPARVDPEFVGVACSRLAAWAEGRNAPRARLEFLQAAALACPANAEFALAVGRAARDLAQYSRAEAWYYRAVGLARQVNEWDIYVKSYLSHGTMMVRRGALPSARRSFLKALRRSRRQGLREGEALALHDLFILEHRAGDHDRWTRYAQQAVQAFGAEQAELPRLAHDIAYAWLEEGDPARALPIFFETLGRVIPAHRPVVLGSVARAAAGAGDLEACSWAKDALAEYGPEQGVAEAWIDMARAALSLGRREEALESAQLAEAVSRTRKEGQMRFVAESIMESIEREDAIRQESTRREGIGQEADDRLARELMRSLQLSPSPGRRTIEALS